MWPCYKMDFISFQLNLMAKEYGFLFDFISAIDQKDRDKLKLNDLKFSTDLNSLPYAVPILHLQFHLHHKLIQSHFTTLKLLNDIELASTCSLGELKKLQTISPLELIASVNLLCKYILEAMFTLFSKLGSTEENFNDNLKKFNTIYMKLVSNTKCIMV